MWFWRTLDIDGRSALKGAWSLVNHNGQRLNIIDWTWWDITILLWLCNFVPFLHNFWNFLCKSLWDWVEFIKLILWISKITKIAHKICIKGGNCRNFSSDNSMEEHYGFIHILVNGKYQRHLSQYRYKCISEKYEQYFNEKNIEKSIETILFDLKFLSWKFNYTVWSWSLSPLFLK